MTDPAPATGVPLELDHITHRRPGGAVAVEAVSLDIGGGEPVSLLGLSGRGKTTLPLTPAAAALPWPAAESHPEAIAGQPVGIKPAGWHATPRPP